MLLVCVRLVAGSVVNSARNTRIGSVFKEKGVCLVVPHTRSMEEGLPGSITESSKRLRLWTSLKVEDDKDKSYSQISDTLVAAEKLRGLRFPSLDHDHSNRSAVRAFSFQASRHLCFHSYPA